MSDILFFIYDYRHQMIGAIVGLILGSFYTALASRILYFYYGPGRKLKGWYIQNLLSNRWKAILSRPSFCFNCKQRVFGLYLIPVVGYFCSKGRCSHCKTPIGLWTLAGEIFPALLMVILLSCGASWALALLIVMMAGHLYISIATDTYLYQLDHENTLVLAILAISIALLETGGRWAYLSNHVYSALGCFIIFCLLYIFYKKGLGMADIFLATLVSFSLALPFALLAIQIAAVFSILYIFVIIGDKKAPAPLGSGLAFGWLICMPLSYLWHWYY